MKVRKLLFSDAGLLTVGTVLAAVVFIFDSMVPLGVAGGVPYVAIVLAGMWIAWRPAILILAGLVTFLTIAGFYTSPAGGEDWQVLANRALAVAMIWMVALLVHYRRRREDLMVDRERALGTAIVQSVGAIVIILDPTGQITRCNRTCEEITGRTQGQLIGMNILDLIDRTDAAATVEPEFDTETAAQGPCRCESFVRSPENGRRRISWSSTPHFGTAGAVDYLILAGIDITEQFRAREAVRESEARFKAVVDHSPSFIMLLDTESRLLMVNKPFREFFSKSESELIGKKVEDFMPSALGAKLRSQDREVVAHGRVVEEEIDFEFLDGRTQSRLVSKFPVSDADGNIIAFGAISSDITERKRAEEDLRKAKELAEQANATKSRFLAAASHDLRQPLYAMSLFLATLMERFNEPAYANLLEMMEQSLESANKLLGTVLDISKLEAGVVKPELIDFPVQSVLDQTSIEFAPVAEAAGNALTVMPCSAFVRSDRALMESILRNLVSNAVRHSRGGRILVGCRRRTGAIRIVVHDTGPGIPPEMHEKIFDEFERLDNPPDGDNDGLGLGLAIVDRTAKLLGCKIELESDVGHGAVFAFEVPLGKAVSQTPITSEPPRFFASSNLQNATIALIEDDPSILLAFPEYLSRWGCICVTADSADGAIASLEHAGRVPDLLLADYHLCNGESGLDAIRILRSKWGQDIPAIIVTADTSRETAGLTKDAGVPLLTKPVRPAKLRAMLQHLLQVDSEHPPISASGN